MSKKHDSIIKDFPHFLHGGDYNPDQWQNAPGIIDEDFRLAELANCNTFSVGIFAWTSYEPREGEYHFEWLEKLLNRMADAGKKVFLSTPSAARPAWMAKKYPEVCAVLPNGIREKYNNRANFCWSSPIFREKVTAVNTELARRFGHHPALAGWHLSNEYSRHCYCDLCKAQFREFLKRKYGTLEALNHAWWTGFWSHTYTDWSEIEPVDSCLDGLLLDWARFEAWQICDFMSMESVPLRNYSNVPVTTNMMAASPGIDYWRVAEVCDFIADDRYPGWLDVKDFAATAAAASLVYDKNRAMMKKPWLLMESTPSNLNWQQFYRLKRPGLHRAEMLLAIGHGADGTLYFQYRKGRGGSEKFHGAVIDHEGSEHTRVFQEVAEVGRILKQIEPVVGSATPAEAAFLWDCDAFNALRVCGGPSDNRIKKMEETLQLHYRAFWEMNIPTDVIESTCDFSSYRIIVAPMLFLLKPGVARRIEQFVQNGGIWVSGYLSNYVDNSNLHFIGGLPGDGLRKVFGIWNEELDGLTADDRQSLCMNGSLPGCTGSYPVVDYAERIHAEGADVLAHYGEDFYAGEPALTVHHYGEGFAYYQSARSNADFLRNFYRALAEKHALKPILKTPSGIHVTRRESEGNEYLFFYNFTPASQCFSLGEIAGISMIDGKYYSGDMTLTAFGSQVLLRK